MGHPGEVRSGVPPSSVKRRNVVQLKWHGQGSPPSRREVVDHLLEMGFKASDIFALIAPLGSGEYNVSFVRSNMLDVFWQKYDDRWKGSERWEGLVPKVISKQPLVKNITILVHNESIPAADIMIWLQWYGEVLSPLRKVN
ncbi:unnamed protein product, partial [Staurois parvus]